MWKSRADKLPPAQFFADLIAHLRNLYPGASLDAKLARAMRDIWVAEWRAGQSAQDTAKATQAIATPPRRPQCQAAQATKAE